MGKKCKFSEVHTLTTFKVNKPLFDVPTTLTKQMRDRQAGGQAGER